MTDTATFTCIFCERELTLSYSVNTDTHGGHTRCVSCAQELSFLAHEARGLL